MGHGLIASAGSPLVRHAWHLVVLGGWLAAVISAVAIDHLCGRVPSRERNESKANVIHHLDGPPVSAAIALVTWPPARTMAPAARETGGLEEPAKVTTGIRSSYLPWVVIASVGAAAIHAVVLPEHFVQSWLYGMFFLIAASMQLSYAALLLRRPTRALVMGGAAGNATILLVWAYSRIIGIPIGPDSGATEAIGLPDAVATMSEMVALTACILALRRTPSGEGAPVRAWSRGAKLAMPIWLALVTAASIIGPRS